MSKTYLTRRTLLTAIAVTAAMPALSACQQEGMDKLRAAGKITIGIHNRSPWGFTDAEGKVTGFHPDLVREAFTPLGISEFDFVTAEFGALIPGLQARRFDMIASGISITPERCGEVIFSEPDLSVLDAVIVQKGNPLNIHSFQDFVDNPALIMAGGRGTLNTTHALEAGVPEGRMMQFPSGQDALSALLSGRAQASVTSAPTAMTMLSDPNLAGLERALPFKGLLHPDGTPVAMYTGIAFRKDDSAIRDAYNERLAAMKASGKVSEIMTRYGFLPEDTAPNRTTAQICAPS